MEPELAAAWITGGLALIAALLSLTWGFQNARELNILSERFSTDRDLRNLRLRQYQRLWSCFEVIPKNPDPYPDRKQLDELRRGLVTWYYKDGGLLVTDATRDAIFALRDRLEDLARTEDEPQRSQERIESEYGDLFALASSLRTQMTKDVFSRKEAELAH